MAGVVRGRKNNKKFWFVKQNRIFEEKNFAFYLAYVTSKKFSPFGLAVCQKNIYERRALL